MTVIGEAGVLTDRAEQGSKTVRVPSGSPGPIGPRPGGGPLSLMAVAYDHYLNLVYDRAAFVDELRAHLVKLRVRRILDCAAGTGFPAIDLHLTGDFETVHCTDGSPFMVDQLRRNAWQAGIDPGDLTPPVSDPSIADPMCVRWQDLRGLTLANYDYVLCRGNSLVYLDTWSGEPKVAAEAQVRLALEAICSRVRVDGYIHLDGPRALKSYPSSKTILSSRQGVEYVLNERVTVTPTHRCWDVMLLCGQEHQSLNYQGRFHSSHLDIAHITKLLDSYCFEVMELPLSHERPQFGAVTVQRLR